MTYTSLRRQLVTGFCIVGLSLATTPTRAATDTFKQSAELGKRTAKTSDDIDKYVAQLDKTEQALSAMSQAQGKDLRQRYESFSKEINSLEQAQKQSTFDVEQMKSAGSESSRLGTPRSLRYQIQN